MIKLIITADDFGYSRLFTKRILELIEEGAITSTSVMIDEVVTQEEQIRKLASLAKAGSVSVGLHTFFKNTNFSEELQRQFEKFVQVFGFEPSYIDIHKMDYLKEGYPIIQEFCKQRKIPCKNMNTFQENIMKKEVITTQDPLYEGTGKTFEEIRRWLGSLTEGTHMIVFHPGYYDPESKSSLNKERETDVENIQKMMKELPKLNITLAYFNYLKKTSQTSNCIIIHGCPPVESALIDIHTDTKEHWIPWVRSELQKHSVEVFTPLMPNSWTPTYELWKETIEKLPINELSVLVGNSCGVAFIVRYLSENKKPIKKLILVAPALIPAEDSPKEIKEFYNFTIDPELKNRIGSTIICIGLKDKERHQHSAKQTLPKSCISKRRPSCMVSV